MWAKGQSGNPEGRKRRKPITDMYTKLLIQNPEKLEAFCMNMIEKAANGDVLAIKEITDRVEGKALQSVDVTDHRTTDSGRRLESLLFAAANGNREETGTGRTQ